MLKFFILTLVFIISMSGCTTLEKGARELLGTSTRTVEETRQDAIKEIFRFDFNTCYEKSKEILKDINTYIYAQKKNEKLIAVFVSETDTTPVGVFFKEIDANNTQVEVSSPSSYAKELVATKLFARLTMLLNPIEEKEPSPKN
ncbi:MAG: hypothetical protein PHY94_01950 [Candidatus Omnitrophica bacterium]|nr:hypothetical protein [Candidatus Omnitrophota bacterium]